LARQYINMKKILVLITFVTIITSCNRKWTQDDRKKFISDCVNAAKGTALAGQAQSYCECMQPIMEQKFPTIKEANSIKNSDMQTPEMRKAALKCMGAEPGADDDLNK
jgi:hypothetical protein